MRILKIKDIGKIVSGSTPKTDVAEYWDGDIPWVTPKEISALETPYLKVTERKITEAGLRACSTKRLPKGSILFTSRAPIGLVAIADIDVCTNQGFKSIILNEGFYPLYIYYVLKYHSTQLDKLGTGTTFRELSKSTFEKFQIPVPSLSEQVSIATILAKTEELILKRKETLKLLNKILQDAFQKIFNGIAGESKSVSSFCQINPKKSEIKGIDKNQLISFIPMANVSEDGEINVELKKAIKDVWNGFTYFRNGDVLFAKITPSMENGKGAIAKNLINGIGFGTTEFHVLRPIPGISNSEWLYYLTVQQIFRKTAEKNMTGTAGQKRVPTHFFDLYTTVLPNIQLQNEFSQLALKINLAKIDFKKSLRELESLFESIKQKSFKGELRIIEDRLIQSIENQISELEVSRSIGFQALGDSPTEEIAALNKKDIDSLTAEITKKEQLISYLKGVVLPKDKKELDTKEDEPIDERYGDPFDVDEETARKVGNKFYTQWKIIHKQKPKSKIVWENISSQQVAEWIKNEYQDYHFSSEMLIRFLRDEFAVSPYYFSSEELKKNLKIDIASDLKQFIFNALNDDKFFIRFEQLFYDAEKENFAIKITDEDFELIKDRPAKSRSGIYFRIIG